MKLRNPRLISVAAILIAVVIRLVLCTMRYRIVNQDIDLHPADADHKRFIYSFWHETILAPIKIKARVSILISKHADGELIAQACHYLGFGVVRGSTTRGGSHALVELWDCSQRSHLIFTPDGPRGPRRKIQPGLIMLASLSGLPIVPVGVGFSRAWRFKSWDRFAVPKPFSACIAVAGPAVNVPPEIDRDDLERFRQLVEERMLDATVQAEQLANPRAKTKQGPHRPAMRSTRDLPV
jgi:lysophospholipid acyltransferase (LPLAT)-like uncharacterized protein